MSRRTAQNSTQNLLLVGLFAAAAACNALFVAIHTLGTISGLGSPIIYGCTVAFSGVTFPILAMARTGRLGLVAVAVLAVVGTQVHSLYVLRGAGWLLYVLIAATIGTFCCVFGAKLWRRLRRPPIRVAGMVRRSHTVGQAHHAA